uniref:Uncharacterized protein n=1 Tax=viral metagenome TaxID=1070528 RepID=A0A6C0F9E8_9ZZZZ|tara:strand:- start:46 stop:198 length:153 start_codon:yes stop_codon:yes gene_type:complete
MEAPESLRLDPIEIPDKEEIKHIQLGKILLKLKNAIEIKYITRTLAYKTQ